MMTNKFLFTLLFSAMIVAIVGAGWSLPTPEFAPHDSDRDERDYNIEIGRLEDFSIRKDNIRGEVDWKLIASSAEMRRDNYFMENPRFHQYVQLDERIIRADSGVWNTRTQDMEMFGNVQFTLKESSSISQGHVKTLFHTDEAFYGVNDREIRTSKPVTFSRESVTIKGTGFVSNLTTGLSEVEKDVSVVIGKNFLAERKEKHDGSKDNK